MTARVKSIALVIAGLLALGIILLVSVRVAVRDIQASERAHLKLVTDSLGREHDGDRAQWKRERDSLRVAMRQRDTVLLRRLHIVHDTSWIPADTSPAVRYAACRAQLDTLATDCAAFRATATLALANADSLHRVDSLTRITDRTALAIARRDAQAQARRATVKSRWQTAGLAVCGAAVANQVWGRR